MPFHAATEQTVESNIWVGGAATFTPREARIKDAEPLPNSAIRVAR